MDCSMKNRIFVSRDNIFASSFQSSLVKTYKDGKSVHVVVRLLMNPAEPDLFSLLLKRKSISYSMKDSHVV